MRKLHNLQTAYLHTSFTGNCFENLYNRHLRQIVEKIKLLTYKDENQEVILLPGNKISERMETLKLFSD